MGRQTIVALAWVGCVTCVVAACSDRPAPERVPAPAPADEPEQTSPPEARWTTLDPPAAEGSLGVSLTATPRGVLATWIEPRGEGHAVRFAALRAAGWSDPSTIAEGTDLIANWADFPRAVLGGDGAVYAHYLQRSGEEAYAYQIQLTRSEDMGAHFESVGLAHGDGTPTEHGFVSMLPDVDGVRLFWLDGRATQDDGGATAIYTARATPRITDTERLDDRTCDCCQTDAAQTPGGPLVVYRDRDEDEVRDIALARWTGAGFGAPTRLHADRWEIAGCPVNGPAVAADGQRVAVAWFTGADGGSVQLVFSDDAGATFGDPIAVDPEQPPGRVDVALVEGGAAVSWLARVGGAGEIRVRFVSDDGEPAASTVVARTATARASGFPVLVRDRERLLVAYRDGADAARVHVAQLPVSALPREMGSAPVEGDDGDVPLLAVGDRVPEAFLRDADDQRVSVRAVADGAPLVLAFFARWCQPCQEELRQLEALSGRFDTPVRVVAVSLDEGSHVRAERTARQWGYTGRVMRNAGGAVVLGAPPLPALFVFDGRGILQGVWRGTGFEDEALLALTNAAPGRADPHH